MEKVRDVVGRYTAPPENALVLCVGERSRIQAVGRRAVIQAPRPGDLLPVPGQPGAPDAAGHRRAPPTWPATPTAAWSLRTS